MNVGAVFWATLLTIGIGFEIFALVTSRVAWTLSYQIWHLRDSGWFSLIIFILLWLIWHFIFDGDAYRTQEIIDEINGN